MLPESESRVLPLDDFPINMCINIHKKERFVKIFFDESVFVYGQKCFLVNAHPDDDLRYFQAF